MEHKLVCDLCPRNCALVQGQAGACGARRANRQSVEPVQYGLLSAVHDDPIEKKPLNHFYPGSRALSLGGFGCNLMCRGCQNYSISRADSVNADGFHMSAQEIVDTAHQCHAQSIAYTYNEPIVWWEWMDEVAQASHDGGLKNIMVTAGYLGEKMFDKVFAHIDAANVDLKGFSEDFYKDWANGELHPVLDTILYLHQKPGFWLEITTMIIPGVNGSDEMLESEFAWIHENLGPDVPVHLSAFFPRYKAMDIASTPETALFRARELAKIAGLHYVYLGNIMEPADTICPSCHQKLIHRMGYRTEVLGLEHGHCRFCGVEIPGRFA